jgi:hypothetical protein
MTVSNAFLKSTKQLSRLPLDIFLYLSIIILKMNIWSDILLFFWNPICSFTIMLLHAFFYNILKDMYKENILSLKINKKLSPNFNSEVGVRQKDTFRPNLFKVYINDLPKILLKQIRWCLTFVGLLVFSCMAAWARGMKHDPKIFITWYMFNQIIFKKRKFPLLYTIFL